MDTSQSEFSNVVFILPKFMWFVIELTLLYWCHS